MRCLPALIAACQLLASQAAVAQATFITVENRSGQHAKIALPGGKPQRVPPDTKEQRIDIETTHPNGVEAKAWWVSNPRELCVIFVRYEGHVVIAGKQNIRCLGH